MMSRQAVDANYFPFGTSYQLSLPNGAGTYVGRPLSDGSIRLRPVNARGPHPITSNFITIFGLGYGDEGKGRTIPDIARQLRSLEGVDDPVWMVVKINGGANSGHTVDGLKHNLLPAGVQDKTIRYLGLGRGVVADPIKLLWELRAVEHKGHQVLGRLVLDNRLMISEPTDRVLNYADEMSREREDGVKRGSTMRGVSNAFARETTQRQLFYQLFRTDACKDQFAREISRRVEECRVICQSALRSDDEWFSIAAALTQSELAANEEAIEAGIYPGSEFDFSQYFDPSHPFLLNADVIIERYWQAGLQLRESLGDVAALAFAAQRANRWVLGEHGQAAGLHPRHSYTPNCTASPSGPVQFYESVFVPSTSPVHSVAVDKAYLTKVGQHLFLTEIQLDHPLSLGLRSVEFGTTTKRQRMVGWIDLVDRAHYFAHMGTNELWINKIDLLGYQTFRDKKGALVSDWKEGKLQACVAYRDSETGEITHRLPGDDIIRKRMQPVYEEYDCWSEDLSQMSRWDDLPLAAKLYVAGQLRTMMEIAELIQGQLVTPPNLRGLGIGTKTGQCIEDIPVADELIELAIRHGKGGLFKSAQQRGVEWFVA